MTRGLLLVAAVLLLSSCGEGASPTAPSAARVSGVWMGHTTLKSVSGGECVGAAVQSSAGSRDIFAAHIQQTDTTLSATVGYQGNQTSCTYGGSIRGNTIDLSLTTCQADRVKAFRCADGTLRDLRLTAETLSGSAANGYGTGTSTATWTVHATGGTVSLGTLTVTADFLWNELGIPHSDFHVFDGSILPGYVDGTVVIPAEVNPFCEKCGWF